jgi:D-xylose transport system substrate-binding protein
MQNTNNIFNTKKIIRMKVFFILFACLYVFQSCDQSNEAKIGFLMESFSSARWAMDKKYFVEKIEELNGTAIVKNSDGSDATQYQQAIELINLGVDVLVVVASNVNTAAAIVREAHKKNIPVIAYDRLIKNCELDYYICFDNYHSGKLQAQYAIGQKPKGNYVIICGDKSDINATNIHAGQISELEDKLKNKDIDLIYTVFVDGWSPDDAGHQMEQVLRLSEKKIDAILTANDGTASGVISALKKFGYNEFPVITGLDAELAACRRIAKGEQSMTVYSPIKELASNAARLAIDLARKSKLNHPFTEKFNGRINVPSIVLKTMVVDKINLDNIIIKDGIYTKEEIYSFDD